MAAGAVIVRGHRRRLRARWDEVDCLPDSGVALTTAVSAPLPHEVRLYEAQRAALHGRPDTDRPVELRFHPESLILWIAIHEVTHLLLPVSAGHGATFVSTMVRVVVAECGQPAGDRFRAELLRHAVPQLPRSASAGVFPVPWHHRIGISEIPGK